MIASECAKTHVFWSKHNLNSFCQLGIMLHKRNRTSVFLLHIFMNFFTFQIRSWCHIAFIWGHMTPLFTLLVLVLQKSKVLFS